MKQKRSNSAPDITLNPKTIAKRISALTVDHPLCLFAIVIERFNQLLLAQTIPDRTTGIYFKHSFIGTQTFKSVPCLPNKSPQQIKTKPTHFHQLILID